MPIFISTISAKAVQQHESTLKWTYTLTKVLHLLLRKIKSLKGIETFLL